MQTITMNRGDWSGKEVTIKLKKDNSFQLFGYTFKVSFPTEDTLVVTGDDWSEPLFTGFKYANEDLWYVSDCGISRENKDAIEAVVQLLCNTI